jgi:1,4-alpha-glucan branching enzyme
MRTIREIKKKVNLNLLAPDAKSVFLAGDFNDWDTTDQPMKKNKNGVWKASLDLVSGIYQYRFFVDGSWQNDPDCSRLVENQFGTFNCVIEVK